MDFPVYNHTNINALSQMKLIKNRAIWGALIVHRKASIRYKIWVTQKHQNFIILPEFILIILNIYLVIWLRRVSPGEDTQAQMHMREIGVGGDEVSLILRDAAD